MLLPIVIFVTSAVLAGSVGRRVETSHARWGFVVLVALAALATWRTNAARRVEPDLAREIDAGLNPYEAFYRAKLWSQSDPRGSLELARQARAFGLLRTCVEAAERAVGANEPVQSAARALLAECKRDAAREPTP